jgi:hypothetical protein
MKRRTIWLILIALLLCTFAQARTIYVNNDGLADFNNIQAAIDDANDGDVVVVKPGRYTGDSNRDIDFKGKAITVQSEAGPETCIIDCQGWYYIGWEGLLEEYHRGLYFHSGEDANSVVQGFTITGGYVGGNDYGGGILCYASSPRVVDCIVAGNIALSGGGIALHTSYATITNCIITKNIASYRPWSWYSERDGSGGGIATSDHRDSNPVFRNCIVSGNCSSIYGGGIYCAGDFILVNCTICGNRTGEYGRGGGISCQASHRNKGVLRNCIIWGNTAKWGKQLAHMSGGILGEMRLELANCTIQGGNPNDIWIIEDRVEGNWISGDPYFANAGYWDPNGMGNPNIDPRFRLDWIGDNPNDDIWVDGDYHLKSQAGRWDPAAQAWIVDDVTSPCIDAGDPNSPIGLEPFPNGGRINMGAYGGTVEASKSYFGGPVCETIVAGDINGDCKVDFRDFAIMAGQWLRELH